MERLGNDGSVKKSGNIAKIREIAKERGLKLSYISQQIGKSNGYLSEISGRNANVPSKYLPAIAEVLGTSVEYINGLVDNVDEGATKAPLSVNYGSFQFDRFYDLCKKYGKMQAHLYKMVGLPEKAGSNLRRTKNVKPEILEVWAKELHTSAAYLNGETDDPAAPSVQTAQPEKEKSPAAEGHGVTDEDLKFALFGGGDVTDAQFEEVKSFARFVRERDANGHAK